MNVQKLILRSLQDLHSILQDQPRMINTATIMIMIITIVVAVPGTGQLQVRRGDGSVPLLVLAVVAVVDVKHDRRAINAFKLRCILYIPTSHELWQKLLRKIFVNLI